MWKQFLSKLPRPKPSKSDLGADQAPGRYAGDASDPVPWNGNSNSSDPNGRPAVKRMSSVVFPSSVASGIEPLLAFKDVPSQEKQNLFLSKLNLCCVVFDFHDFSSDSSNGSMEKDMKRQTLVELVDFVSAASSKFTEPMISASCKMFAINLFRAFPPNCSRLNATSGGENDEDEPMFDPAWSHLQLVYELMLKLVASSLLDSKVAKKYLDHGFILRLLDLFESEDPRERDCLKTILHRIYGKFMVHRPFIRKSVSNIFYRFVFETERHNGIAELLEVFGSVISGFALPLKEEHKMFLWRALIPLHKPKSVGVYLHQLTHCIAQFIEKEPKLVSTVVGGLLKCWPVTSSQKEVMFLGEMEEVLESTNVAEFQKIMIPMFRRIACCLNSSHFQVAERALFLCNNDHVANLISQNRHVILPIIFPALERNTKHWNQAVLNMTQNVSKFFSDMDEQLFLDCRKRFEEEEQLRVATEEKRRLTWERLESAAVAFQVHKGKSPAVFNTPISPPMITANLR